MEGEDESLLSKNGDNWSCTEHKTYDKVKVALKSYSMNRFKGISEGMQGPVNDSRATDALRVFAFGTIHHHTLALAVGPSPFRGRLVHAQMATVQIIGYFCGSRAVSEMHEIKVTDFVEHGPNWIEFKPSGVTKTTKVNAEYVVTQRASSFIAGRNFFDLIR